MTGRRKILVLLGAALLAAGGGAVALRREILPERSPAFRGRLAAERAGCFACHGGASGAAAANATVAAAGAAAAPASRKLALSPDADRVPSLFHEDDPKEAREWIERGSRPREAEEDHAALVMPGFAGRLSSAEIDDLTTFVVLEAGARRATQPPRKPGTGPARGAPAAASPEAAAPVAAPSGSPPPPPPPPPTGAAPPAPTPTAYVPGSLPWPALMAAGERLARGLACFACHGEMGQGGVSNPRSLKGYVPGFFGGDFDVLTRSGDRSQVRAWIVEGAPREFLDQGALGIKPARWFIERQAINMPSYAPLLLEGEADLLADYVTALRALGPLDAPAIQDLRKRLKGNVP